ncbi:MAG: AAA family ATPase [Patescibacteria group bacterium]|nr:AAA family ATPase [Patescibacteria group bacterium]
MKYTKFIINNFKGIESLTLDFDNQIKYKIFTFVGLNESGKTTILEAIDFLQKDIKEKDRHKLIPKKDKTNFNDVISVKATIKLEDDDEIAIKKYADKEKFILEKTIKEFTIEKKYIYKGSKFIKKEYIWDISLIGKKKNSAKTSKLSYDDKLDRRSTIEDYIEDQLLPPIIYYPNFSVNFPNKIYLQEREGESKEQEFYRNMVQDVLDSLNNNLTIEEHIISRMNSESDEDKEALESVLIELGSKITDTTLKSWEEIFRKTEIKREITIKDGIEGDPGDERYFLEIKLKQGSQKYAIEELSLGFRWFFAFLLFTEFRKHRIKDKGEILFLLDEPASNLHSTVQGRLLNMFRDIISKSKLIYTTHSHHLINPEWLEGAYIIKNSGLGDYEDVNLDPENTKVDAIPYKRFVVNFPGQKHYFKPILDSLDYKPSSLEMVPDIIIVEGKNDFYAFKYIYEVIMQKKEASLHFYPGNGAGKNDQVIRLYNSWGRKLLVFMDGDKAGRDAKEKYNEEIGVIVKDRVYTLFDIKKEWKDKATEDLFSPKEQLRLIQAIDPNCKKVTKTKINNAIQNLLFLRQKVDINKTTIARFEKIFDFLSKKLI